MPRLAARVAGFMAGEHSGGPAARSSRHAGRSSRRHGLTGLTYGNNPSPLDTCTRGAAQVIHPKMPRLCPITKRKNREEP